MADLLCWLTNALQILTLASWAFSLNDSGVMVGGRAFSGMSTQVVTPPAAAACDPVLNPANIGPHVVKVPARCGHNLARLYQPPHASKQAHTACKAYKKDKLLSDS